VARRGDQDATLRVSRGAIRSEGGTSFGINGCADHIHILARLRQDKAVSDVIRGIKANSSGWFHRTFLPCAASHGRQDAARLV
jgi:hypothetical protein